VRVIRSLGDRLYGIHLKDFAEQKDKTNGVILGRGHLDVVGVFRALKAVNFPIDGALSLEYEENAKDPIADIRECLAIAEDAARQVA
jgi:sugar phosphate isomerase/epimerase